MLIQPKKLLLGKKKPLILPNQPRIHAMKTLFNPAPGKIDRSKIDPHAKMYLNDQIGDCTSAGIANGINAVASLHGGSYPITDDNAQTFYSETSGYVPGDASTDRGAYESEVLTYLAQKQYPGEFWPFSALFGTVDDLQDRNALMNIMFKFYFMYLGVELAMVDQLSINRGAVLGDTSIEGYNDYDPTPGSWGGHCLLGWDYSGQTDSDLVSLITWGGVYKCTWTWLMSRMDEAHAVAFPELAVDYTGSFSPNEWDKFKADNSSFISV